MEIGDPMLYVKCIDGKKGAPFQRGVEKLGVCTDDYFTPLRS